MIMPSTSWLRVWPILWYVRIIENMYDWNHYWVWVQSFGPLNFSGLGVFRGIARFFGFLGISCYIMYLRFLIPPTAAIHHVHFSVDDGSPSITIRHHTPLYTTSTKKRTWWMVVGGICFMWAAFFLIFKFLGFARRAWLFFWISRVHLRACVFLTFCGYDLFWVWWVQFSCWWFEWFSFSVTQVFGAYDFSGVWNSRCCFAASWNMLPQRLS